MTARDEVHRLVDQLPEQELVSAERYLRFLRDQDPLLRALHNAPIDDEPETEEERRLVEEATAEIARGEYFTLDEVKAHLDELARTEAENRDKRKKAS